MLERRSLCSSAEIRRLARRLRNALRAALVRARFVALGGEESPPVPCLAAGPRCEFGHLLANDPHLLAVGFVGGEPKHFVLQRRSRTSTRSRFAQSGADGVGVAHAGGPYDLESRHGGVIQSHMDRASHGANVARIVLRPRRLDDDADHHCVRGHGVTCWSGRGLRAHGSINSCSRRSSDSGDGAELSSLGLCAWCGRECRVCCLVGRRPAMLQRAARRRARLCR